MGRGLKGSRNLWRDFDAMSKEPRYVKTEIEKKLSLIRFKLICLAFVTSILSIYTIIMLFTDIPLDSILEMSAYTMLSATLTVLKFRTYRKVGELSKWESK